MCVRVARVRAQRCYGCASVCLIRRRKLLIAALSFFIVLRRFRCAAQCGLYGCNRSKSRAKSRGPLLARYAKWGMLILAGQPINFHRSAGGGETDVFPSEGRKVKVFGELKALILF